jgi:hypothetical protein|tara:strand:- start:343 stop:777 length:435 start_codon:yes stop_codon:yes gene_type:complete
MVDTVTTQTIQDGGRAAIIKTTVVIGAGTPPAPQEVTLVDVSTLSADPVTRQACVGVTLQKVTFASVGVAVELQWKANANVLIFDFPRNWTEQYDFSDFGIPNNAGAGKNGDIVALSQANAATPIAVGDTYTFLLTVSKSYASV